MKEWKEYRLGELAKFSNGINFDKNAYFGSGIRLITVSDFGNNFSPDYESLIEVSNEVVKDKDLILKNDILFVRSNGNKELVGRCMLIDNVDKPTTYSGFCIKCHFDNENVSDPKYFTYYFKNQYFRKCISNASGGTNIQNLNQEILSKHKVQLPPLPTQQKIASILSAYDKLIQNYKKQIEALQTAASELYKEWFVRFRFPGYQNTKFENGIPEGWKVARLKDIAKDVGKTITKNEINYEKDVYIPIDCIPNHNMALTEVSDIENAESSLQRFESGDILFGAMRVYFHKVILAPMQGVTRKTCFVIHAKKDIFHNYLYSLLFSNTTINYANTISVGATMPYVRWNDFIRMQCLFPSEKILNDYNKIISPIFKTIMNSYKYLSNLTQQRDLLLPRLMSGKLEVK